MNLETKLELFSEKEMGYVFKDKSRESVKKIKYFVDDIGFKQGECKIFDVYGDTFLDLEFENEDGTINVNKLWDTNIPGLDAYIISK